MQSLSLELQRSSHTHEGTARKTTRSLDLTFLTPAQMTALTYYFSPCYLMERKKDPNLFKPLFSLNLLFHLAKHNHEQVIR
jgi:hypothetical protein